jgi:hypothetical protein
LLSLILELDLDPTATALDFDTGLASSLADSSSSSSFFAYFFLGAYFYSFFAGAFFPVSDEDFSGEVTCFLGVGFDFFFSFSESDDFFSSAFLAEAPFF